MKKLATSILLFIKEELITILILVILYFSLQIPVNYYIITGGGTSNVSSRIQVEDAYQEKGSFNISYVTELKGTVITFLLSYVVPHWERESADLYKYSETENMEDIEFRSDLDLKAANATATYWAYTLANKEINKLSSNIYVIGTFEEFPNTLKVGDEIIKMGELHYETIEEYKKYLQTQNDEVEVTIIRKGKEQTVKAKLYDEANQKIMGVGLERVDSYETKPKVDINFRPTESGPSGGLITTLEIYNQLTKEDLTKGYKIAGTGTIELDGTIGAIGGVEHKLLGAEDADTDYFLVPSGENYKEAKKYKKEKKLKIKLIEVKNIKDAILQLEALE